MGRVTSILPNFLISWVIRVPQGVWGSGAIARINDKMPGRISKKERSGLAFYYLCAARGTSTVQPDLQQFHVHSTKQLYVINNFQNGKHFFYFFEKVFKETKPP